MTITELAAKVGTTGTIFVGGLNVAVTVRDVKVSYGRTRWLVEPVAGSGRVWVETVNFGKGE
jgi:hypothetical protein